MHFPRPTYAGVTATLALFIALGGSSYAALTITGSDIRNGTVTSADLKNGTVKGSDVDNSSLTGSDLKNGSVTGSDIDDGSLAAADFAAGQLPAGPQGPAGPAGPQGPAGATSVITRRAEESVPPAAFETVDVSCLPGERAVGGGASITAAQALVVESGPMESDGSRPEDGETTTGWSARGGNETGSPQQLSVYVLCASP